MGKKKKGGDKKGKKKPRETKSSKKWEKYKDGKKIGKPCPKCGSGVFLAEHKDRLSCGKCRYMEVKKSEPKK